MHSWPLVLRFIFLGSICHSHRGVLLTFCSKETMCLSPRGCHCSAGSSWWCQRRYKIKCLLLLNLILKLLWSPAFSCVWLSPGVMEWEERRKDREDISSRVHACLCAQSLSRVQLFATRWTAVRQAPLSMGSPGKNTGVGCHFQGTFSTQGSNPYLLHCRQLLYHWATRDNSKTRCHLQPDSLGSHSHAGSCILIWVQGQFWMTGVSYFLASAARKWIIFTSTKFEHGGLSFLRKQYAFDSINEMTPVYPSWWNLWLFTPVCFDCSAP